jgi:hypothetical protein
MVKGWCAATSRPASGSQSNAGKPVTQSQACLSGSTSSILRARWRRSSSSAGSSPAATDGAPPAPPARTTRKSPTTATNRSPASIPVAAKNAPAAASSSAFANCPASPSSVRFTHSAPAAPPRFATSCSSSVSLRDRRAPPGTRMPRMRCAVPRTAWNRRNSVPARTSVTSTMGRSNLRSGLSVPYLSIDSA